MRKLQILWLMLFMVAGFAYADSAPVKVVGATTAQTMVANLYKQKGFTFIDVRPAAEFQQGHIAGAVNLDVEKDLNEESLAAVVKKDQPVVFYCSGLKSSASATAVQKALDWGWNTVFYYRAGFTEWKNSGLAVE